MRDNDKIEPIPRLSVLLHSPSIKEMNKPRTGVSWGRTGTPACRTAAEILSAGGTRGAGMGLLETGRGVALGGSHCPNSEIG